MIYPKILGIFLIVGVLFILLYDTEMNTSIKNTFTMKTVLKQPLHRVKTFIFIADEKKSIGSDVNKTKNASFLNSSVRTSKQFTTTLAQPDTTVTRSTTPTVTPSTSFSRTPTRPTTGLHCVEKNICNPDTSVSDIYHYTRTDFYTLLEKPVNTATDVTHSVAVVPRLVHFVLFGDGKREFKFHYMIAFMAVVRFVKPEKIYFWHDNLPVGKYWNETKERMKNLLFLVRIERPTSIYGKPLNVIEHVADVVRLEALLEYGGMYFDTDAIVVNPIDPLLKYDVTMGAEDPTRDLANGMLFSTAWSDFFKLWHIEYKQFNDNEWGTFSVVIPFQLSKRYPNLLHIEQTSLCRPNWLEIPYLFGDKEWDFKRKNYVIHLYWRFGKDVRKHPEELANWNCTVGRVLRYIYYEEPAIPWD